MNKDQLRDIVITALDKGDIEPVTLVYLFGSRARALSGDSGCSGGTVGPLSDYDFGIVTAFAGDGEESISRGELHRLQSNFARLLNEEVDVVLLNSAPIELQYSVIASGVLIFAASIREKVEYEAHVLGRYGDYLAVLRQQRDEIIQGGRDEARVQRYRKALGATEHLLEQARAAKG